MKTALASARKEVSVVYKYTTIVFMILTVVFACVAGYLYLSIPPPPAAVAPTEVRIGTSFAFTGPNAIYGEMFRRTMEIYLEMVNEKRGGIYLSKYGVKVPVRFIWYDDKSDGDTCIKVAERLITVDKVHILAPSFLPCTYTTLPTAQKYETLNVAVITCNDQLFSRDMTWCYSFENLCSRYARELYEFMATLSPPIKKIAILCCEAYWLEAANDFKRGCEKYGWEYTYERHDPFPTDFSAWIAKAKAYNPDAVVCFELYEESLLLARQMKEMGFRPKFTCLYDGPQIPDFVEALGAADSEGLFSCSPGVYNWTHPWTNEFLDLFEERFGTKPYPCSTWEGQWFAGLEMIYYAIEKAGDVDPVKIKEVLDTNVFWTITTKVEYKNGDLSEWGFLPELKYTNVNIWASNCVYQVQDSEIQLIWPLEAATSKEIRYPLKGWGEPWP